MKKNINVAIVGVGNCASSLIQGIEYYSNNEYDIVGIMHDVIGGYSINNIEPVLGIDVNINKIGKKLSEAIGCGYFPYSFLENLILQIEGTLNSNEYKKR